MRTHPYSSAHGALPQAAGDYPAAGDAVAPASQPSLADPSTDFRIALIASIAIALLLIPTYPQGVWFPVLGVASTLMPAIAGILLNARFPAMPLFAVSMFGVQHVVAPMFFISNPELIVSRLALTESYWEYFSLACTATFILSSFVLVAVAAPSARTGEPEPLAPAIADQIIKWSWVVWTATIVIIFVRPNLGIGGLDYVWALTIAMGDVAMLALVFLLPLRQCRIFIVTVVLIKTTKTLDSTMLADLGVALATILVVYAHRQRWRRRLFSLLILSMFLLVIIQSEKLEYRKHMWGYSRIEAVSGQAIYWAKRINTHLKKPNDVISIKGIWPLMVRLNQGRIVERIVDRVPDRVPYADGETFKMAFKLLVPRAMWPDKPSTRAHEVFETYTGHKLQPGTSMGVGPLGECYLNYGRSGLWAFAVYALSLAVISRAWVRLGARNPLWWAWFSFIFFFWLKFESDFSKGINAVMKSGFYFGCALILFPIWRAALGLDRRDQPVHTPPPRPAQRRLPQGGDLPSRHRAY